MADDSDKKPIAEGDVEAPPELGDKITPVEPIGDSPVQEAEADGEDVAVSDEPAEVEPQPEPVAEDTPFDDEETAAAINDIASKDSDDIIAEEDAEIGHSGTERSGLSAFFHSKAFRWVLFLLVVGGVGAAAAVPVARYWILNTAGVRVSTSVTVLDNATQSPLKGIELQVAGKKTTTDSAGKASLTGLRLGPQTLAIEQAGYGSIKRRVVLGWGSNPQGNVSLKNVGVQYVIEVHDYLSGKPLVGVAAGNEDVSALSDKNGKITLTLPGVPSAGDQVTLSKDGYRTDQLTLDSNVKAVNKVAMVVSRKMVYVTKQSGKYDVYKVDIDGKNPEVLLPGTGSETSNLSLVVSPDGNRAAYVSTRDNKADADGTLLNSLTLINIATAQVTTIAQASQIQLIDWVGTRLVFEQVSAEDATSSSYVVTSYNYTDNTRLQLVAAKKLGTVQTAQGMVYYAVAADSSSQTQPGLYKIGVDGTGKQQVFKKEVETVLRSDYNTYNLQDTDGTWFSYSISSGVSSQISTPKSLANRLYADNSNRSKSLWINQGALTLYDVASGKDTVLQAQGALAYPLEWFGDTAAVYRVSGSAETADYVVGLATGDTAHKVIDVTASYGVAHAQ